MKRSILIVDDEPSILQSLLGALTDEGFDVSTTDSGEKALDVLREKNFDLLLLDIWLPGMDGLKVLREIKELYPDLVSVVMSGHANVATAVKATKLGAYDFVEKPLSLDKLLVILDNATAFSDLYKENIRLRTVVHGKMEMIGSAPAMVELKDQIHTIAPRQSWVLIMGENGTGKELVASAIHSNSSRQDKPFIELNCAAIPEDLIESELFGHEKGAFTGATQPKRGKFDLANGGTLFLDEIADMSLKTQAKILRILQEQRFERIGGSQTHQVDVRVIAATNKNLLQEIKTGRFRKDLYYRLNVIPIHVPALRDRREDIIPLFRYYFNRYAHEFCKSPKRLSKEASQIVQQFDWPGNVRELKNMAERLSIMKHTDEITVDDLPIANKKSFLKDTVNTGSLYFMVDPENPSKKSLRDAKSNFEREFILTKLRTHEWNISKTAQVLGIERTHLYRKMKMLNIRSLDQERDK